MQLQLEIHLRYSLVIVPFIAATLTSPALASIPGGGTALPSVVSEVVEPTPTVPFGEIAGRSVLCACSDAFDGSSDGGDGGDSGDGGGDSG